MFTNPLMNQALTRLQDETRPILPARWRDLDMLAVLEKVEQALPALLRDGEAWQSFFVDYERPYLMRIYRKVPVSADQAIFISCHYFFSPDGGDEDGVTNPYNAAAAADGDTGDLNLYHPHPWAAGFRIVRGAYKQALGLATDRGLAARPPINDWRIQSEHENSRYAFNDPHIWHMVVPLNNAPVSTIMVTYAPQDWQQEGPRPPKPLRSLTPQETGFMLDHFRNLFPQPGPQPLPGQPQPT